MAQYESGQYINEFLNEMPNLLLTMRKMDVDQMLETRRLDQGDVQLDLEQQRVDLDKNIRDRLTAIDELRKREESEEFERKEEEIRRRKAIMTPFHQRMVKEKKFEEEYRKQKAEMSWWDRFRLAEERGKGLGTFYGDVPKKSKYGPAVGQIIPMTEVELAQQRAAQALGVGYEDVLTGGPSALTKPGDLFDEMIKAGGGQLYGPDFDDMMDHPQYGQMISTNKELMALLKNQLLSQVGNLALTQP